MVHARVAALAVLICVVLGTTVAGASWWNRDAIEGSGEMASEERSIGEFTRLRVDCAFDIEVRFGKDPKLVLTFDDNLLEYITTEVRGKRLTLDCSEDLEIDESCRVELVIPKLTEIEINGAADIRVHKFEGSTLEYVLNGAGNLEVDGSVEEFEVELSGAGSVDARDLVAERAEVNLNGAGSVDVHATDFCRANLSGVGNIDIYGDPRKVREKVSGIGSIDWHD